MSECRLTAIVFIVLADPPSHGCAQSKWTHLPPDSLHEIRILSHDNQAQLAVGYLLLELFHLAEESMQEFVPLVEGFNQLSCGSGIRTVGGGQ